MKELQPILPADHPDGSTDEPSGRGFFPGPFNGADVTVKDAQRYGKTDGWGFYNFNPMNPRPLPPSSDRLRNVPIVTSQAR